MFPWLELEAAGAAEEVTDLARGLGRPAGLGAQPAEKENRFGSGCGRTVTEGAGGETLTDKVSLTSVTEETGEMVVVAVDAADVVRVGLGLGLGFEGTGAFSSSFSSPSSAVD